MKLIQEGRTAARVMVVGEAPGDNEVRLGRPFVGASGHEFDDELSRAGWSRSELFITNVSHERPPGNEIEAFFAKKSVASREGCPLIVGRYPRLPIIEGLAQLQRDIDRIRPLLIIALGNTALWALTGETGILKWRGSIMPANGGPVDGYGIKLIPTIHPAAILREYAQRATAIQDLRRARRESSFSEIRRPVWNFTVASTIPEIEAWMQSHIFSCPVKPLLVADVENFYETDRLHQGRIICIGFATSESEALCVPFIHRVGNSLHYWATADEELQATLLCKRAFTEYPVIFFNSLHDCQIIAHNWGFMPNLAGDPMVMQHVAFPGMAGGKIDPITGRTTKKGASLSLAFCSSLYCDYHRYWKEDGRGWDAQIHDEEQFWFYNCEDCVRAYEVMKKLTTILNEQGLWTQYLFEMELFAPVFEMMFRGIRFGQEMCRNFKREVDRGTKEIQQWIEGAVGHPFNAESNKQMQELFYHDFQISPILHRKTHQPTLDDRALETLTKRKPVLKPLIERIQALRSLAVYKENFLESRVSRDGRMRFALNVAGPETMRFSSNPTAFGEGHNVQNLPREE